jgi:hypothetical protein
MTAAALIVIQFLDVRPTVKNLQDFEPLSSAHSKDELAPIDCILSLSTIIVFLITKYSKNRLKSVEICATLV